MNRIILLLFSFLIIISHVNSQTEVIYETTTSGPNALILNAGAAVGNNIKLKGTNKFISEIEVNLVITNPGALGTLEINIYSDCPVNGNLCGGNNVVHYFSGGQNLNLSASSNASVSLNLSTPLDIASDSDGIIHVTLQFIDGVASPGGGVFWITNQNVNVGSRPNSDFSVCGSSTAANLCDNTTGTSTCGLKIIADGLVNDNCADAIDIKCGGVYPGFIEGSTETNSNDCGLADNLAKDVWFRFTGNGDKVILNVGSPGSGPHFSAIVAYQGSCNGLTCVPSGSDSNAFGASEISFVTDHGVEYYVKIEVSGIFLNGTYELSMQCLPIGVPIDIITCTDQTTPIDLSEYIVCLPNGSGTWSVATGSSTPGGFNFAGFLDPSATAVGTYLLDYKEGTHIVSSIQVTVNNPVPFSGIAGPALDICEGSPTMYLFSTVLSGEDPGGTWSVSPGSLTPDPGTFNASVPGGSFMAGNNAPGTYLFDYTQTGSELPGVNALTCHAFVEGAFFAFVNGAYILYSIVGPTNCNPDTRVVDCPQGTLQINITGNTTSNLSIAFSGGDCESPNLLPGIYGIGVHTFDLSDFPEIDPSQGICVDVIAADGDYTNLDFDVILDVSYEAIPSSGCPDKTTTVQFNIICCADADGDTIDDCIDLCPNVADVALNFAGGNIDVNGDYIEVPHHPSQNIINGDFTIEAWIYPTANNHKTIVAKGHGFTANITDYIFGIWDLNVAPGNGKLGLFLSGEWQFSNSVIGLNKWTHVAVTFDNASDMATFYIDGSVDNQVSYSSALFTNADDDPLFISQQGYSGSSVPGTSVHNFVGAMDDIIIWNKALSLMEIMETMSGATNVNETGLVAYYDFNDALPCQGNVLTTLVDKGPNGMDGTLMNFSPPGNCTSDWTSGRNLDSDGDGIGDACDGAVACPPSLDLTGAQSTSVDYESGGYISSDQVINSPAQVDYDATTEITLLESFEVKAGAVFHAFIDGCGNALRQVQEIMK